LPRLPAAALPQMRSGGLKLGERRYGRFHDWHGEVFLADVHKMGGMIDRLHRDLTDEDFFALLPASLLPHYVAFWYGLQ
jgi:hypothetical protein